MSNKLHPQESSHRSSLIATDLALAVGKQIQSYKHVVSDFELFHIQMQCLYIMIGLMGATKGLKPEQVCDECKKYFENLRKEQLKCVE